MGLRHFMRCLATRTRALGWLSWILGLVALLCLCLGDNPAFGDYAYIRGFSGPTTLTEGQSGNYSITARGVDNNANESIGFASVDIDVVNDGGTSPTPTYTYKDYQYPPDNYVLSTSLNITFRDNGTPRINGHSFAWISGWPTNRFDEDDAWIDVTVNNVAPTNATVYQRKSGVGSYTANNITINEGDSIERYMNAKDPGYFDDITFTVDGKWAGTITTNTTQWRQSNLVTTQYFQDTNGSYVNTGTNRATDSDGANSYDTIRYKVNNVAPTVTELRLNGTNGNITINEGDSVSAYMKATDPGIYDNLDFYAELTPNGTVFLGSDDRDIGTRNSNTVGIGTYTQDGSFTVRGRVEDDETSRTLTRTVTVLNVAPTITSFTLDGVAGNITINEGESVRALLAATDPADPLSYSINGISGSDVDLVFNEHNGGTDTFGVVGRVDDDDTFTSLTRYVTVNNLDPILTGLTSDLTVWVGSAFNFFASATDPGGDSLLFEWDFDYDGSVFDVDFTGQSGSWTYMGQGLYDVYLRISDGDGGFAYGSFQANVVPEPASLAVWGLLGVLGMAVCRLRRRD